MLEDAYVGQYCNILADNRSLSMGHSGTLLPVTRLGRPHRPPNSRAFQVTSGGVPPPAHILWCILSQEGKGGRVSRAVSLPPSRIPRTGRTSWLRENVDK